ADRLNTAVPSCASAPLSPSICVIRVVAPLYVVFTTHPQFSPHPLFWPIYNKEPSMYAELDSTTGSRMNDTPDLTDRYANYKTIRRNGSVVAFEPSKISVAVTKAFIAVQGSHAASSAAVRERVSQLTDSVVSALMRRKPEGGAIHIEDIQDQ